jgi:hypothetical protein
MSAENFWKTYRKWVAKLVAAFPDTTLVGSCVTRGRTEGMTASERIAAIAEAAKNTPGGCFHVWWQNDDGSSGHYDSTEFIGISTPSVAMDFRPYKVPASMCPRCGRRWPRDEGLECPQCASLDDECVALIDDGEIEVRPDIGPVQIQPLDYGKPTGE